MNINPPQGNRDSVICSRTLKRGWMCTRSQVLGLKDSLLAHYVTPPHHAAYIVSSRFTRVTPLLPPAMTAVHVLHTVLYWWECCNQALQRCFPYNRHTQNYSCNLIYIKSKSKYDGGTFNSAQHMVIHFKIKTARLLKSPRSLQHCTLAGKADQI